VLPERAAIELRRLQEYRDDPGPVEGKDRPHTIKACSRLLAFRWGYSSGIDGIAGPETRAALKRFANDMSAFLAC
jgi:peptidoglycan hydrolase-like protein with peptidoglycan-binding domain